MSQLPWKRFVKVNEIYHLHLEVLKDTSRLKSSSIECTELSVFGEETTESNIWL